MPFCGRQSIRDKIEHDVVTNKPLVAWHPYKDPLIVRRRFLHVTNCIKLIVAKLETSNALEPPGRVAVRRNPLLLREPAQIPVERPVIVPQGPNRNQGHESRQQRYGQLERSISPC